MEVILNKKYEIIPISQKDYEFGFNIKRKVFKEYVEKTWGKWNEEEQLISYKNSFKLENNYIIVIENKKIGWLNYEELDSIIKINQIFIIPEYQNKGIGTNIINEIIEKGRQNKKTITLRVLKVNEKALKLYKKMSFIVNEENDTHYYLKLE
jgi:ribosomal protein S18 acetylase RimI-like enzyme